MARKPKYCTHWHCLHNKSNLIYTGIKPATPPCTTSLHLSMPLDYTALLFQISLEHTTMCIGTSRIGHFLASWRTNSTFVICGAVSLTMQMFPEARAGQSGQMTRPLYPRSAPATVFVKFPADRVYWSLCPVSI
jgi:hypothetical protein